MASFPDPHNVELLDAMRDQLREMIMVQLSGDDDASMPAQDIQSLLNNLPTLTEQQIIDLGHKDSVCPICFTTLLALLAEQEMALVMDSPAHPVEELGVTRLSQPWQCGHIFCRRDISRWILQGHGTCPMCRRSLVQQNDSERNNAPPPADPIHLEQFLQSSDILSLLNPGPSRHDADRSEYSGMYS